MAPDGEEKKRQSQADLIIKLALENGIRLFTDQRDNPYVLIYDGEIAKTYRLRTKRVRSWLAGLLWTKHEKAPGSKALESVLNVLEAQANKEPQLHLYNRVAPDGSGGIWIDMADPLWRAVHVTREGWKIDSHPPILFRRYAHQKALSNPVRGGSVVPLLDLTNIKNHDGNDGNDGTCTSLPPNGLLYIVALISYFIPGVPHVLLIVHGQQGSGKSWAVKIARSVVDPSSTDLLTLPRRHNELIQLLDHHYFPIFDNVSSLPQWTSDMLCRAVTGAGSSKRRLYTDDEDEIYEFYRCVGINGISIAAEEGDILDRALIIGLQNIEKEDRKTEKEINEQLESIKGEVFGGTLDILVKALNIYPHVELEELFRMADFTHWGVAITQAMGLDPLTFIEAYRVNIEVQRMEAMRASAVVDVLIAFMITQIDEVWSGTASQLLSELNVIAKDMSISISQREWPKSPSALSKRLNKLAPNLPVVGLELNRDRRPTSRTIHIIKTEPSALERGDLRSYGEETIGG